MSDTERITQLILHERQGRDRGWWEQLEAAYWPDSRVHLSWYNGSGPGFIAGSRNMIGRGDTSVHRMSPPVVHVVGDRGYVEAPTGVEFRVTIDGVLVDLVSRTRLNYRVERRDGVWKILSLDAIYERDTITPAVPGTAITIPQERLAGFRPALALISYYLQSRGYPVGDNLLGDDQPRARDAFYAEVLAWLHAGPQR
ncbi:nuclear transport factor 2 family protein [Kitasatospora sp. NBC_01266]|uniref:nuclear transport factor 2 family protein n=1 Tax=Kitasatospora sp. NBC_01266 TaxID=2903572 RepID=UPI002E380329|nr:nuclear transport factor 2 family protein [Kitasatospora sp. NBC_01266]